MSKVVDDGQDDLRDTHLPSKEEWTTIRQLYSETYPIKPMLAYILVQTERIRELEEALNSLWPGLVLDLRYADADDDIDALRSRVETISEVMAGTARDAGTKP